MAKNMLPATQIHAHNNRIVYLYRDHSTSSISPRKRNSSQTQRGAAESEEHILLFDLFTFDGGGRAVLEQMITKRIPRNAQDFAHLYTCKFS